MEEENSFHKRIPMMLNCFGIDTYDKLHGFMIHSVMLAVFRMKMITLSNFQMLVAMLSQKSVTSRIASPS